MDRKKISFPLALTFDDILLLPGYAGFSRSDISLETKLTKNISLKLPFVSAPMDTVTESELAIELARLGGIGIIHRNLTVAKQASEVEKVLKTRSATPSKGGQAGQEGLIVGAAVGAGTGFEERVEALIRARVSVIVVDSAHGFSKQVIDATKYISKKYPKMEIIAGNIATADGAKALIDAGADGLRVGMGPGAICTTRVISGMGVPQVTALMDTVRVAKKYGVPVIADGGIKYSGDMVKALALGASTVMMGSFFASCAEAPGTKVRLLREQVPSRFQSIFEKNKKTYLFKSYRGMGSTGAMQKGAKIKSEGEFHGKSYKDRVLIAEGVEGLVPVKGSVKELTDQAVGGIKSGMYYVGAKDLNELTKNARFTQITQASLTESHPHSVLITNAGENYQ
ncbi:MAG: Inosine-5'-monophosphate dehydrogenase [Microgenomates group bacterium GW2011_GWA2_37_6]|nr:MAG: Inosine-5'-monophosphate dehydrogenase [Microgenomates group bacterium GW2011_GWA2_37_6]